MTTAQSSSTLKVLVNTGPLSYDNGAIGPMALYFELAQAIGIEPTIGIGYGRDALEIPTQDWPTVQSMLEEACLLYRMDTPDSDWLGIKTDKVRTYLGIHR